MPSTSCLSTDLILVNDMEAVVVDVLLVEQRDVLARTVVTLEHLNVVLLDADGLFHDAVIGSGEFLREELVPLGVGKRDVVQGFELST